MTRGHLRGQPIVTPTARFSTIILEPSKQGKFGISINLALLASAFTPSPIDENSLHRVFMPWSYHTRSSVFVPKQKSQNV